MPDWPEYADFGKNPRQSTGRTQIWRRVEKYYTALPPTPPASQYLFGCNDIITLYIIMLCKYGLNIAYLKSINDSRVRGQVYMFSL